MTPSKAALIADDDEFFRMALGAILTSRLGFAEVIETGSLDTAIEQLGNRSDITLALFDLAMPGMQTAASLRAVRECFPALRIAVVSGSGGRRDILMALDAGVHGYVPKGLGAAQLPHALKLIVDGTIYVPPSIAELPPHSEEADGQNVGVPASQTPAIDGLTRRQGQVLELLVEGRSNKEIARALELGEGTVKVHLAALFRSLGVTSRAAAAVAGAKLLSK